ncbi:hypothetical protein FI667_g9445, partial [Globisporangium splendens]
MRSAQITELHREYQLLRTGMLALRRQISEAAKRSENLALAEASIDAQTKLAIAKVNELTSLEDLKSEMQKLREKKRCIEEKTAEMDRETNGLTDQHAVLENSLKKVRGETQELSITLQAEEKEAEMIRRRLQQDIVHLKADIALKYSVIQHAFSETELERIQMTNEDTYSVVGVLKREQDMLDVKLIEMCIEIQNTEESIAELVEKISNFDRGGDRFDTAKLQNDVTVKHKEVQALLGIVREKESELEKLEAQKHQVNCKLAELSEQIRKSKSDNAREKIELAQTELHQIQEQFRELQEANKQEDIRVKTLKKQIGEHQKKSHLLNDEITHLHDTSNAIENKKAKITARLADQNQLIAELGRAKKLGQKNQVLEDNLRAHEQSLKESCFEEEAKLKAELQAWDEKVEYSGNLLAFRFKVMNLRWIFQVRSQQRQLTSEDSVRKVSWHPISRRSANCGDDEASHAICVDPTRTQISGYSRDGNDMNKCVVAVFCLLAATTANAVPSATPTSVAVPAASSQVVVPTHGAPISGTPASSGTSKNTAAVNAATPSSAPVGGPGGSSSPATHSQSEMTKTQSPSPQVTLSSKSPAAGKLNSNNKQGKTSKKGSSGSSTGKSVHAGSHAGSSSRAHGKNPSAGDKDTKKAAKPEKAQKEYDAGNSELDDSRSASTAGETVVKGTESHGRSVHRSASFQSQVIAIGSVLVSVVAALAW